MTFCKLKYMYSKYANDNHEKVSKDLAFLIFYGQMKGMTKLTSLFW